MTRFFCILFAIFILNKYADTARILAIFPFASISHQVVFRALMHELGQRGHELVIVTPNPAFPKDLSPANVMEIDTSATYQYVRNFFKNAKGERGAVITPELLLSLDPANMIIPTLEYIFEHPEFKQVLDDKTRGFDLVISEEYFNAPLVLARIYNAPVIWLSSFYGLSANYELFGAPTFHPILYPELYNIRRSYNSSYSNLFYELYMNIKIKYELRKIYPIEEAMVKKYFGEDANIHELRANVDLMFINVNHIFEGNRPMPPNVIHLGGLHMKPRKEIPVDLKSYLDNSKRGVVYLSLGSNVRWEFMDPNLVEVFIRAVEIIPYDVIWKQDLTDLPRRPTNARIEKWYPQRDLLHHPNVKAFITQGGLQSADETIDAGVPVVVLPFFADQFHNAERYVKLGVGIQLDVLTLQSEELAEAVKTVIRDDGYRRNIKKLSAVVHDQPFTPLERAIWWTEYVIRHGGAKHLRSLAANVSWTEYLMLDVVFTAVVVRSVSWAILIAVLKYLFRLCFGKKKAEKVKVN